MCSVAACECNDQGSECHPETGKCYCTTKGIAGDHCERCDTNNHYHGDPTNKGSCFCKYDSVLFLLKTYGVVILEVCSEFEFY